VNLKMVQDRALKLQVVYDLLNGAICSDFERPLPPISRSHRYLMLNVSETVQDTDKVSMEY